VAVTHYILCVTVSYKRVEGGGNSLYSVCNCKLYMIAVSHKKVEGGVTHYILCVTVNYT
jgi:hypothetical protein